jgi:hypothetical protein
MTRAVRVLFLMVVTLGALSVPAAAQVLQSAGADAQPLRLTLSLNDGPAPWSFTAVEQAATTKPQVRPALQSSAFSRRRASMVGYLDDPIVSSKVRIRYELGFENTAPDRAEFFYAKCGCFGGDAPGPRPGAAIDLDFTQFFVQGEYSPNERFSVFGELPIRSIKPQDFNPLTVPPSGETFGDESGIGDIRAGAKVAVSGNDRYTFTLQLKAFLPTGEADQGLGTDHVSLEPSALYFRQFNRGAIEAQGGIWLPYGGADATGVGIVGVDPDDDYAGRIFFYGFGPSVDVIRTDRVRVSPIVELIGWHVLGGFSAPNIDADGTKIYNIKFGARVTMNQGSFYFGYGKALTDATWYENILRFEYRHGF